MLHLNNKKNKKKVPYVSSIRTRKYKHTLAGVIMVYNEEKGIRVTIESMLAACDCIVMLDTDSTDGTYEIVKKACIQAGKVLHWKKELQEPPQWWLEREDTKDMRYFDFSVGRNSLLKLADNKADYLLLCDANDIVLGGDSLRKFIDDKLVSTCKEFENQGKRCSTQIPYCLKQAAIVKGNDATSSELHINWVDRLIKTKQGLHYVYPVHELLSFYKNTVEIETNGGGGENDHLVQLRIDCGFSLYQDRLSSVTTASTSTRYVRDRLLLERYCKEHPEGNTHVLFHLAQTYNCLGDPSKAYSTYFKLSKLILDEKLQNKFKEVLFSAELRMGDILANQKFSKALTEGFSDTIPLFHYNNALKLEGLDRVEPLLRMAQYYISLAGFEKKKVCWPLVYMYLHQASKCAMPREGCPSIELNESYYKYVRWHFLAIASFHVKEFNECFGALDQIMQNTEDHHLPQCDLTNRNTFLQYFIDQEGKILPKSIFSDYYTTTHQQGKEESYIGNKFIKLAHLMKNQDLLIRLRNSVE